MAYEIKASDLECDRCGARVRFGKVYCADCVIELACDHRLEMIRREREAVNAAEIDLAAEFAADLRNGLVADIDDDFGTGDEAPF